MRIQSLTILLVFMMFLNQTFSQDLPDTLTIDFLNWDTAKEYKYVKYKKKYYFKIVNVNRSLYKAEGFFTQADYNGTLPNIFSGIKLPSYLNLSLPPTSKDDDIKNTAAAPGQQPVDFKTKINSKLDSISIYYLSFTNAALLNNKFINLAASCGINYESIEKQLVSAVAEFVSKSYKSRSAQSLELDQYLTKIINDAIVAKREVEKLYPEYVSVINQIVKQNDNTIIAVWVKKPLTPKDPNYERAFAAFNKAKKENEELITYKDSTQKIIEAANGYVDEMSKFQKDNKIQTFIDSYNKINQTHFTFISEPVRIAADELKAEIKISSEAMLPCNTLANKTFNRIYKTVGGWKIDFSSGVFFNGGNHDFLGRDIIYKPKNDTVVTIQSANAGSRLLLSIGSLMHVYYRGKNNVYWAISPGLSTTTSFDGINFHLGGSAIFGSKNRLVITAGTTFREAKILDRNYAFEKEYLKKDLPDTPPLVKAFPKFGFFLSLTYNWSKLTKQ